VSGKDYIMDHKAVKALAQAVAPIVRDAIAEHVQPLIKRLDAAEARIPERGEKGEPGERGYEGTPGLPGAKGESGPPGLDGRDGQPGIAGRDGKDGAPGRDGIDGNDGFGFDDMETIEDERSYGVIFRRGDQVKVIRWQKSNPAAWYRGIWKEGEEYKRGETVTWNGSSHIALVDTIGKPETTPDWRLAVKRGRDGKDGVIKPAEPKLVALK
jgi:collagen type III alpha